MPRFPLLAAALTALLAGGFANAAETRPDAGTAAPLRARVLELEAGLVKTPALYLVLDPAAGKLEVRSRGLVLDTVPVEEVRILHYRPLLGGGGHPQPEVPGIWTVIEGPGDTYREVIAPDALKPYVPEEERVEETAAAPDKELPMPPSSYFVKLANGWQIGVFDREPQTGFFARFLQSVEGGWKRLLGRQRPSPPVVALAMAPDDARRIHHVFRTDLAVLVLPAGE
jgi:hypothetical protein